MRRIAALLLVLAVPCAFPLSAAETLVANVAEFDAAVKAAKPGDTIVLRNGEWRDAELNFRAAGELKFTGRITLRAETPGQVILTGKSRLSIGGKWLTVEGLHWKNTAAADEVIAFRIDSKTLAEECRLRDCAIVDDAATDSDGASASRKWVSIYGRRNVVEQCRFDGKRSAGALLVVWIPDDAPQYDAAQPRSFQWNHVVENNFFGPRAKLGKNGGETIRVGDSKTSLKCCEVRVFDNYFYRCDGEAEIISNKSCDNAYIGNVFVGCSGALTLRHGHRCSVGMTIFFADGRPGCGGVRVVGENHKVVGSLFDRLTGDDARAALCIMNGIPNTPADGYSQVRGLLVENNRFVGCKQNILVGFADKDRKEQSLAPDGLTFKGNSVNATQAPVFEVVTQPTAVTSSTNTYSGDLGLSTRKGWTEPAAGMNIYEQRARQILTKSGPAWLRPTEDFLPKDTPK